MGRFSKKIEGLFTVNRKENNYRRTFLSFVLFFAVMSIFPLYIQFEEYQYNKYKVAYQEMKEMIQSYKGQHGTYPILGEIDWKEEKNLHIFFSENQFNTQRRLYYVNQEEVSSSKTSKYTYLIDADTGTLYTREFVVYKVKRWHFAFY